MIARVSVITKFKLFFEGVDIDSPRRITLRRIVATQSTANELQVRLNYAKQR